jgi:hypothetical protein
MSELRVNSIGNLSGTKVDTTHDIVDVALRNDVAYAQINKIAAQSFTTGHQNILWDEVAVSKNISLSSNQISFALTGVYQVTVGMRFGNTATDAWTGINVFYPATSTIVAQSYGTGNVTNDPGPMQFTLLADITNTNQPYQVRLFRAVGSLVQTTPDTGAGRAIVMTIVKVS